MQNFSHQRKSVLKFSHQEKVMRNSFSAWRSYLQMAITSSFQLQFAHCLKHWTPDFSRFKMIYSMWIMDFRKFSKLALKLLPFEFRIACEDFASPCEIVSWWISFSDHLHCISWLSWNLIPKDCTKFSLILGLLQW